MKNKRISKNTFIEMAKEIHGDKYDYTKSIYKSSKKNIEILCLNHGSFYQTPQNHILNKQNCPVCANYNKGLKRTESFLLNKFSNITQPEEYKIIPLTKGQFAKVDNEDFDKVKGINWNISKRGYVENTRKGKMHRYITNCPGNKSVDHKNHDKLDNRKSNLRICDHKENMRNTKRRKTKTSSIYKGVFFCKRDKKWNSKIQKDGKQISLGYFHSEIEAAKVYDKKAIELFGEFALTNFK